MERTYRTIRVASEGGTACVTLARPSARNAFDAEMISELDAALDRLAEDGALRALVLTGEGSVFSAGADASWMRAAGAMSEADGRIDATKLATLFRKLDEFPCPTIAAVQGAALGGGAGLVAAADIAIAEEGAKFGFTEVRLGIVPAVISSFVVRAIGPRHARRYFTTGEIFDAGRAAAIGLVSEVVPSGKAAERAAEIVAALLQVGPAATRVAKSLVAAVAGSPLNVALPQCAALIAAIRRTPEAQEGLAAFLEKRPPAWNRKDV